MMTTPPTTRNTDTIAMAVAAIAPVNLLPELLQRFGSGHSERVFLIRPQMPVGAYQRPYLILRCVQ